MINTKRRQMLEELEGRIIQSTQSETLFIIHWKIK